MNISYLIQYSMECDEGTIFHYRKHLNNFNLLLMSLLSAFHTDTGISIIKCQNGFVGWKCVRIWKRSKTKRWVQQRDNWGKFTSIHWNSACKFLSFFLVPVRSLEHTNFQLFSSFLSPAPALKIGMPFFISYTLLYVLSGEWSNVAFNCQHQAFSS